jgi:hypothetical protein
MKREEEINIAAKNKYPYIKGLPQTSAHQAIFIEAAEWADRTMLDRVCEWLKDGGYFVNSNETIEDFRKAMKG